VRRIAIRPFHRGRTRREARRLLEKHRLRPDEFDGVLRSRFSGAAFRGVCGAAGRRADRVALCGSAKRNGKAVAADDRRCDGAPTRWRFRPVFQRHEKPASAAAVRSISSRIPIARGYPRRKYASRRYGAALAYGGGDPPEPQVSCQSSGILRGWADLTAPSSRRGGRLCRAGPRSQSPSSGHLCRPGSAYGHWGNATAVSFYGSLGVVVIVFQLSQRRPGG